MADNTVVDPQADQIDSHEVVGSLMPATDPTTQQSPPDPGAAFAQLGTVTPATNRYGDDQTMTTAALGALAQQRTGLSDPGDPQGRLESLLQSNQAVIQAGQEKLLRNQIAAQARLNQNQSIQEVQKTILMNPNNPDYTGLTLKHMLDYGLNVQNSPADPDELEMQGISHLQTMAAHDPDQAVIFQDLQKNGDVLDRVRDNTVKIALFNREMDALKKAREGQGKANNALDFVSAFEPFRNFFSNMGNVKTNNIGFFDLPSTQVNKQVSTLWNMPLDDFRAALPGVFANFQKQDFGLSKDLTQALETAQTFGTGGMNNSDALSFNAWTGVDIAGFIPLERMLKVPSKLARVVGNRALSADISASELASDIYDIPSGIGGLQSPGHSIEESLPSSLVPPTASFVRPDIGTPADISDRLASMAEGVAEARRAITTQDRLSPAQVQEAVEQAVEKVKLQYRDDPVVDMKSEPVFSLPEDADLDNLSYFNARGEVYPATQPEEVGGIKGDIYVGRNADTGIYSLNMYLGKRYSSGGFITKEGAENAAIRRGFDLGDVKLHQNSDSQWFIKIKQNVTETGVATPELKEADFPSLGLAPKASAFIKSADNILPEMFNQARLTQTIGKQKYLASVVGPYVQVIKQAGARSAKHLSKVLAVGERDQKWFNYAELQTEFERIANRLPNHKEVMAYYAAKEISDLNYHVFNSAMYSEKARRGVVTVSAKNEALGINIPRVNGKVVEQPDLSGRFFDLDEGVTVKGDPDGKLAGKLASGNYRVIDLESPYIRPGEDPVKTVIAHVSSSTVGPLNAEQLGYVAGGSRENRFKWFVKQAKSGTFKDGGEYWMQPTTHIAARTKGQATKWANDMEHARQTYFGINAPEGVQWSEAQIRKTIENSPAESYDKFKALIDDGTISKDHPFEVLYDRQMPDAVTHLGDDAVKWIDNDASPEESSAISQGRMYYSAKGDRLKDPHNEYAEIVDPFTTLHRATINASQTYAFGDYNKKVIDEWARVAADYMDQNSIGNNRDSYNLFFNGKLNSNLFKKNPQFANQLEATRNTHKRLLGLQSPEQRQTYHAARVLADWVEDKKWLGGEKTSGFILDRMSNNPVAAVRGMVFDAKLGFFDPGQLIVQTQTAFAAASVHPLYGARSAAMMLPLSHVLVNRSPELLEYYASKLSAIHGLHPDDFKDMVHSLRNSGWLNVGGDMMQLDQFMNTIGGSAMGRVASRTRELGRIPFNMSEKFNRTVAYSISWKATRDKYPELLGTSREFQNLVNRYADKLSMNMTSSSAAFWQKGVLSVPTQFLAYQARVLENILPKTFGGSAQFAGWQKARLAIGQVILYGATGAPLGNEILSWAADQYKKATGQQMTPELWRGMSKGLWDTALFYSSGGTVDTDFASRAGQGAAWTDFFRKMSDGSMRNNVLSVALGPSGAVTGKVWDGMINAWRYFKAEQTSTLTSTEFEMMTADITSEISALSRAQKALWLWKTGTIRDPKSGEVIVSADKLNSIAAVLGIPMRQETEFWKNVRDLKDRDATVQEWAKMIAKVRRDAFQAMIDGDENKMHHYERLASGLMMSNMDDPLLVQEIAKATDKELNYNDAKWESQVGRMINRTGYAPIGGQ